MTPPPQSPIPESPISQSPISQSPVSQSLSLSISTLHHSSRPHPWSNGGNLPWDDPDFSRRMLREHLDESHGAASRVSAERQMQIDWIWQRLKLQAGQALLDITCGPGLYAVPLAQRGLGVHGVDFSPASIAYARQLAQSEGVAQRCTFEQEDVRRADFGHNAYDAALFLYGQAAVFEREEARALLQKTARALRPGGWLCLELLDQERVDKEESSWWYAGDEGLWGDGPFISLGQRFWYPDQMISCERYFTIHIDSGKLDEILLCDQTYALEEVRALLRDCGFEQVDAYPAWDGLPLYDAPEWIAYVARKAQS